LPTLVKRCAAIGSGVTVLPGIVGQASLIAVGAVIPRDVPGYAIVVGNPARVVGDIRERRPGGEIRQ